MNELQKIDDFNAKIYGTAENPLFLAKDIADMLEIKNNRDMLNNVDEDEKLMSVVSTSGQNRNMWFLTEDGLYEVLMISRKPQAKVFKKKVKEILKTIRKHGAYMTDAKAQDVLSGNGLADMLSQAAEQLRAKDLVISEMKPKALFAESVAASTQSILIGELAKYLKQNGVDIGANRLFAWLREHGWLINRKGEQWNQPTQKGLNRGLFEIKKRVLNNPDGTVFTTSTTKVTGKGQIYFVNKFLQDKMS